MRSLTLALRADAAGNQVLGWTTFAGDEPGEALHPMDQARVLAAREGARGARAAYDIRYRALATDGTWNHFQEIGAPEVDADGHLIGLVGSTRDVTDLARAERAIREGMERLEALAEITSDWLWETDPYLRLTYLSESFEAMTGCRPEDFLGKTHAEAVSADPAEPAWAGHLAALEARRTFREFGYSLQAPGGQRRHVILSGKPVFDETGVFAGYRGIGRDVTAQRLAETALAESEMRFRAVIDNAPSAISIKGLDGRFWLVNRRFCEWYGVTAEQANGKSAFDLFEREVAERRSALDREALEKGSIGEAELDMVFADGTQRRVQMAKFLVSGAAGEPLGIGTIDSDVTREHKQVRQLTRGAERLRQAAELAGVGYWSWDLERDRCSFTSEENARLHGLSPEGYLAATASLAGKLAMVHPEDRDEMAAAYQGLRAGQPFDKAYRLLTPVRAVTYVREVAKPQDGEASGSRQAFGAIQDVTRQRQVERQLRHVQRMEALGQLSNGIAHDFKNHLTAISLGLEALEGFLGGDRPGLQTIRHACANGIALAERLLALSRGRESEAREIGVEAMLAGLLSVIRRVLGPSIDVVVEAASGLWPVEAEVSELESALLNLAINARDAMPSGGVLRITARNVAAGDAATEPAATPRPGDFVLIEVEDDGAGMPAEVLERAFEPFYTTKAPGRGSGLGLTMVGDFARQTGGRVTIESRPGAGTRIGLYIPPAGNQDEALVEAKEAQAMPRGRGETILLVEADELLRQITEDLLLQLGYRVLTAGSGREAFALVDGVRRIDLILSDVALPGDVSGPDMVGALRDYYGDVKVLLMAADAGSGAQREVSESAAAGLIQRPFKIDELAHRVRLVLDPEEPAAPKA